MTSAIRVMGDALAPLLALTRHPEIASLHSNPHPAPQNSPTSLVLAVDLSLRPDRREAKAHLVHAFEEGADVVRAEPSIRHVFLVLDLGDHVQERVERAASAVMTRSHASFERDLAREVEFTYLDIGHCTSPEVLAQRIQDHAATTMTHEVAMLEWRDIVGQSIAAAARQTLC